MSDQLTNAAELAMFSMLTEKARQEASEWIAEDSLSRAINFATYLVAWSEAIHGLYNEAEEREPE